jgi:hypothetical protein
MTSIHSFQSADLHEILEPEAKRQKLDARSESLEERLHEAERFLGAEAKMMDMPSEDVSGQPEAFHRGCKTVANRLLSLKLHRNLKLKSKVA